MKNFIISILLVAMVSGTALDLPPINGDFFIMQFGKENTTEHTSELSLGGDADTYWKYF